VRIGSSSSDWFTVEQGVPQGAPLLMILFQIPLNLLLNAIQESWLGANIGNTQIGCPTSADDIGMVTTGQTQMQGLVDIAHGYSIKWRFKFSSHKCMVLVYGDNQEQCTITLGNELLQQVSLAKYLGTMMGTRKNMDAAVYEKRLTDSHKIIYSFL
jgi:hypothetical protein